MKTIDHDKSKNEVTHRNLRHTKRLIKRTLGYLAETQAAVMRTERKYGPARPKTVRLHARTTAFLKTIAPLVFLGLVATSAEAQTGVSVQRCQREAWHPDCVTIRDGKDGAPGPKGDRGERGPQGLPGLPGTTPEWPSVLAAYDFLPGPTTLQVTVPKRSGHHDKLLYRPGVAALINQQDGAGRCIQVAYPFHATMPFTGVTVDAERTFSWHDASGYWSEPWDVTLPCIPF